MKAPQHNLTQSERTVTVARYLRWQPELNRRIWEACRQQAAAHNRAIEELLERPETPLRKSLKRGAVGLQGLWLAWRQQRPGLAKILQAIWRPGVALAKTRTDAWEAANEQHADGFIKDADAAKDEDTSSAPRQPGRRRLSARTLFRSRKRRDRARRNRLVVSDNVRALDARTVRIPAVGDVELDTPLPDGFTLRAVTLIERTPAARGRNLQPEQRSWKIHLTTRIPAPLQPLPEQPNTAGLDHGVVHALTVAGSTGEAEHLHYEKPDASRVRRYEKLGKRKSRCRRRRRWSRKRRALQRQQNHMRGRALRQRAEQRRMWANRIAKSHDLVGIERLHNANMRRSARGTAERPGSNVAAKSSLNRKLSESAPGYQTAELTAACVRHGTRYRLVPARGTSLTCARCGHRNPKNRESQADFRCQKCSQQANADANAAEVIRLLAEAHTRVGVSRSWATEQVARSAKAARGKAARARGATATRRSSVPETLPEQPQPDFDGPHPAPVGDVPTRAMYASQWHTVAPERGDESEQKTGQEDLRTVAPHV